MNILILDNTLQQVSLLSDYISVTFNRVLNDIGSFEINVNLNMTNAEELKIGRFVFIEEAICGIIERAEVVRQNHKGGEILTVTGVEIKDITKYRITVPPSGVEKDEYASQTTETIVRSLINKHLINPTDLNRAIDFLTLGAVNTVGYPTKDFSTRYKQLDSEIYQLLQEEHLGLAYGVNLTLKEVSFSVIEGTNRTIDQQINPPAIFALKLGTAIKNVVLQDIQSMRNYAYVGGEGEGVERTMVSIPINNEPTGIERKEVFVDASDVATSNELTTRGNAKLAELSAIYEVNSESNYNTIVDYELGDWVTFLDYRSGAYENLQITGIIDTFAGSSPPQRSITFGRSPLNISQAINSRLSGVNNLLTK